MLQLVWCSNVQRGTRKCSIRRANPFRLCRSQFPVRLALAMTINRAQGQSFDHVGLSLAAPVSTHGQLYVALLRTTDPANLAILLDGSDEGKKGWTRNVVSKIT